ncbi:MAG: hypothetical protein ABID40_02150 [Candidatus Bipolaricaulota bacterium]
MKARRKLELEPVVLRELRKDLRKLLRNPLDARGIRTASRLLDAAKILRSASNGPIRELEERLPAGSPIDALFDGDETGPPEPYRRTQAPNPVETQGSAIMRELVPLAKLYLETQNRQMENARLSIEAGAARSVESLMQALRAAVERGDRKTEKMIRRMLDDIGSGKAMARWGSAPDMTFGLPVVTGPVDTKKKREKKK